MTISRPERPPVKYMVKVQECQPVNKQAAMGISHKQYETIGRSQHAYLSKRRLVTECPILGKPSPLLKLKDRKGIRNGKVVVVGWCSPMENYRVFGPCKNTMKTGAWVVKCDCGKYERRRPREIASPPKKEYIDACTFCRSAWAESVKTEYAATGIKPKGGLPTHKASTLLTQPKETL